MPSGKNFPLLTRWSFSELGLSSSIVKVISKSPLKCGLEFHAGVEATRPAQIIKPICYAGSKMVDLGMGISLFFVAFGNVLLVYFECMRPYD